MRPSLLLAGLVVAVAGSAVAPRSAPGFGHLWEFTEVYSNADGTVQFIEMFSEVANENGLSATFLRSAANAQEFHFASDPVGSTVGRQRLIATAGFAAHPGTLTPDYVMPDSFFRVSGDTRHHARRARRELADELRRSDRNPGARAEDPTLIASFAPEARGRDVAFPAGRSSGWA